MFPQLEPAGEVPAHVAHVKPEGSAPAVKILHHMVICVARKRLWIQNPYFLPEPEAIDAFGEAVKRGVDVRVMVPSAEASDMPIVQHAAHRNFEKLLACGVRIFEYPKTLIHQKVMTIDGVWCAVGSTNFDDRAFEINDEITLGFKDEKLARQLEEIFERDAKDCVELELEKWKRRGAFAQAQGQRVLLVQRAVVAPGFHWAPPRVFVATERSGWPPPRLRLRCVIGRSCGTAPTRLYSPGVWGAPACATR